MIVFTITRRKKNEQTSAKIKTRFFFFSSSSDRILTGGNVNRYLSSIYSISRLDSKDLEVQSVAFSKKKKFFFSMFIFH